MANKSKKKFKIKASLPNGFKDRTSAEIRAQEAMLAKIKHVYELYGFEPMETPAFEYTQCLGKFLPDTDRPNEGVFSIQDEDGEWLSLRYDLTAPLARHIGEHFMETPKPLRSYRMGYVYRNEKPGPGRFRQFMQCDADIVGAPDISADAEMCMMMADTLDALGLKGHYVIRVNNRKILDGVMEAIGLSGDENADKRLNVMRAIDKLDKFGIEGVRLLLGKGRKDESGDFTEGAELSAEQIKSVCALFEKKDIENEELNVFKNDIDKANYSDRIKIDTSVVRGLEYYTGIVFEAEVTFPVKNDKGEVVRFGSVGGGGRYDGLISRFRSEPTPCTGFSIGVSRLMSALESLETHQSATPLAPVLISVMDKEHMSDYQKMAQELRAQGIRAEVYLGGSGMKAQFKYADRRGSPCVLIQGSEERDKNIVQIKDLFKGKELSQSIDNHEIWKDERPAQFEVARSDMVAEVQKLVLSYQKERS